jgi:hypothetical protein
MILITGFAADDLRPELQMTLTDLPFFSFSLGPRRRVCSDISLLTWPRLVLLFPFLQSNQRVVVSGATDVWRLPIVDLLQEHVTRQQKGKPGTRPCQLLRIAFVW